MANRWLTETRVEIQVIVFLILLRRSGRTPCKNAIYNGWAQTQTIRSATAKLVMKSSALGLPRKRNLLTTKHTRTLPIIPTKLATERTVVKAFNCHLLDSRVHLLFATEEMEVVSLSIASEIV